MPRRKRGPWGGPFCRVVFRFVEDVRFVRRFTPRVRPSAPARPRVSGRARHIQRLLNWTDQPLCVQRVQAGFSNTFRAL
jgi:hypothetical protein